LFAGVDLTGDEVNQNGKATADFYGSDIPYAKILSGSVPTPPAARHFVATVSEMFKAGRAQ
jgi:lipid-binding SYLF domain-containing protein